MATDPHAGALSEQNTRLSKVITALAAGFLLVGALVFIVESDSWYLAFKAIHVLSAVLWIGGGAFLTFMAIATERADDPARLVLVVGDVAQPELVAAALRHREENASIVARSASMRCVVCPSHVRSAWLQRWFDASKPELTWITSVANADPSRRPVAR